MPRTSQKSGTPTSTSSRFSKLLKKRDKKGKTPKSSKSQHHLEIVDDLDTPPVIAHRKSSPINFINPSLMQNLDINHESSSDNNTQQSMDLSSPPMRGRSLSHRQYRAHPLSQQAQMQKLNLNETNMNTTPSPQSTMSHSKSKTVRNPPPPPPPKKAGHKKSNTAATLHHTANIINRETSQSVTHRVPDNNININIELNNKDHLLSPSSTSRKHSHSRKSKRRSRRDSDEPSSPHTPQSPAERFISHLPRQSIEHKINMKQLLFEMIEMKRQIKSLKKDVKYLKTENDLCHRRITFLEQTLANNDGKNKGGEMRYPLYKNDQGHSHSHSHQRSYQFLYRNESEAPPAARISPQPDPNIMTDMDLGAAQIPIQTRPKRLSLSSKEAIPPYLMQQGRTGRSVSLYNPSTSGSDLMNKTKKNKNKSSKSKSKHKYHHDMDDMDQLNLDENIDNEDIEARLRKLSRKLSDANVFSDEYKRLQFELDSLMQQQGIDDDDYYEEIDENKYSEYNDKTMLYKKQEKQGGDEEKANPFIASDSIERNTQNDINDDENTQELKSLCTLSRRSTGNVRKSNENNDKYHRHQTRRRESASASGMEIVD